MEPTVRRAILPSLPGQRAYPIIPCDLCGSQETLQRKAVKRMLQAWESETPGRIENIFRAPTRNKPSQLADPTLFDFSALGLSPPAGYPDPARTVNE